MTTKIQKKDKSTENLVIEYLVSSGLDKRDSSMENSSLKIYLSESQEQKVLEYCNVFGVSVKTMLNSCIQYVIFLSKQKGVDVKSLKYYPKHLGSNCHDVMINIETLAKLKESGVEEIEEASKYAIAGIKILYEKNLTSSTKDRKNTSGKN